MPPEAFPGVQTFFAPAARPAGETNENSAAPEGFAALTGMEGFYIADLSGTQSSCFPLEELPRLPAFTLRTLRLLTLEIHLSSAAPWWRAVEWTILSESWLKLKS
jgi:hypothetical protein